MTVDDAVCKAWGTTDSRREISIQFMRSASFSAFQITPL